MSKAPEFLDTSKLGFGCMRLPLTDPEDQTSIDIPQFAQMVDTFLEAGNTYFDTAFVYHDGASETALREALVKRHPRESYTIATKCLAWACPDAASAKACLGTSLERLGTDYVDYFLLHNVGADRTAKFDEYGMWEFAAQMKAAGKVRHIGLSMHDNAECLEQLLTEHPDMEFVQLQVNYLDWDDPVTESRKCMEVAAAHGVPVIIMEPARGGRLANLPERAAKILRDADPDSTPVQWAYRFCWNLPNVITVLSGASTLEQMQQNVASYAANRPLDDAERATLDAAIEALKSVDLVPCTACRYCVKDCPQHVMIPEILGLLNLEKTVDDPAFAKELYSWQTLGGPAGTCIQCGNCEAMCPQSIDIIHQLEVAADHFES